MGARPELGVVASWISEGGLLEEGNVHVLISASTVRLAYGGDSQRSPQEALSKYMTA